MFVFQILLLFFFLSGTTALIYEVIWVRLLSLTFGNTVYAIGIVLTAFMSGLSLGSFLLGRWADSLKNLLNAYALLEVGIAVSALLSPFLLNGISSAYLSLSVAALPLWVLSLVRYFLSVVVLLIPTTLMGGTLPVLSRYFIQTEKQLEDRLGTLYSVNTIGGVLGTFLVGFFLLRTLGISLTLMFTAFVNVSIGAVTFFLAKKYGTGLCREPEGCKEAPLREPGYRYALVAFFASGFTAMVYEVAWSRLLVGVIGSTTYSFSLILMGFLSGIGLGSLLASRISRRSRLGLVHFSTLEILIGLACFSTLFLFGLLPSLMLTGLRMAGNAYSVILVIELIMVFFYLLVPTTLFGATFPIVAAVYSGGRDHRARNIGTIYASNTAGAILGSCLAAFLLIPLFGSIHAVQIAAFLNILVGVTGYLFLRKSRLMALSGVLLLVPLLPLSIADEVLVSGVAVYGKRGDFSLEPGKQMFLYLKEGLNATIAVTTNDDNSITLSTNGKADASTGADMRTQLALAYFPLLLHAEPHEVLIVGYGSGVTVKAATESPEVRRVDVVEIEPAVIKAAALFEPVNKGVVRDPKVRVFLDDARSHILTSPSQYDVIISEPSNPWISGIANLYSREFYEIALMKLREGGIFCQWVQLYGLNPEDLRMVIRTFSAVFPEAAIWQSNPADIMLIGSRSPLGRFDYSSVARKLRGEMAGNLRAYLSVYDPMDFFSYFVTDSGGVKSLSHGAPMNTDDVPLLEFHAPFSLYADTYLANNQLLGTVLRVPDVKGYGGDPFNREFLFRKTLNSMRAGIPIDRSRLRSLRPRQSSYLANRELALDPRSPGRAMLLTQALSYESLGLSDDYEDLDLLSAATDLALDENRLKDAFRYEVRARKVPRHILRHSDLFARIGLSLMRAERYRDAADHLRKSAEINPYNFPARFALINVMKHLNQRDAACNEYRAALQWVRGKKRGEMTGELELYCKGL